MDSTFLNVTKVEGIVESCDVLNHSAAMRLVRSRYALRGRKELKSELGGEEEEEGRVTEEKGKGGREGDMASCHLAPLHSESRTSCLLLWH